MIVIDSSVWIDYFNGRSTPQTNTLERLAHAQLLIGDLILVEVLQGFSDEDEFGRAEEIFAVLEFQSMAGREARLPRCVIIAVCGPGNHGAQNHRCAHRDVSHHA